MKSFKKVLAAVIAMAMVFAAFGTVPAFGAASDVEITATRVGDTVEVAFCPTSDMNIIGINLTYSFDNTAFTFQSCSTPIATSVVHNPDTCIITQDRVDDVVVAAGEPIIKIIFDFADGYVAGNEYTFGMNFAEAYAVTTDFENYDWCGIDFTATYKESSSEEPEVELTVTRVGDTIEVAFCPTSDMNIIGINLTYSYDSNAFTYNSCYTPIATSVVHNPDTCIITQDRVDDVVVAAGEPIIKIIFDFADGYVAGNEYTFGMNFAEAYAVTTDFENYSWCGTDFTGTYKEDAPATYQITWKVDGQEDVITTVNAGETPVYPNGTPTKAADAQYTYTFKAWDPEVVPAAADATYTATWDTTVNEYNIKFVNYNGTVLQESTVAYGETPVYNGETPAKDPTNTTTYTFKGWDPEIVPVTGDATYTAQYEEAVRKYIITWVIDGNNETEEYEYNATPSHADPVKEGYNFIGWDPQIAPVTADATYTAKFEEKVYYTVTFVDGVTGGTISTVAVESGAAATAPTAPTHEGYTFTGWDKEFSNVTEDLTVTAQYTPKTYRLWLYFVDENNESHSLQAGRYFDIPFGTEYDVAEYIPAEIDGWVFVNTDNLTSGTMPAANVEINAFYHELKAPAVAGEKAELRERETADGKSDIRFIFKVTFNDSCVNYKGELVGPTKDYYEVTGIAAVLNAGNSDLTVNGQNIWKMADDSFQYTVVLKSIPESAYDKTITATPNITYVMGNDSATVNGTPISASVNSVQNVD